ncbi:hypothetical protein K501DRAFT_280379 [Backusella circina FSU 941]|nr:hypothetical protein K501DRAFT_280379 [Backusella circina FSU 941]
MFKPIYTANDDSDDVVQRFWKTTDINSSCEENRGDILYSLEYVQHNLQCVLHSLRDILHSLHSLHSLQVKIDAGSGVNTTIETSAGLTDDCLWIQIKAVHEAFLDYFILVMSCTVVISDRTYVLLSD